MIRCRCGAEAGEGYIYQMRDGLYRVLRLCDPCFAVAEAVHVNSQIKAARMHEDNFDPRKDWSGSKITRYRGQGGYDTPATNIDIAKEKRK